MTISEAKVILSAHDLNGAAPHPPEVIEALELARTDSELAEWLRDCRDFDEGFGQALGAIAPPADLEAQILAAAAHKPVDAADSSRRRFSPAAIWMSVAAAVCMLAGIGYLVLSPGPFDFPGDEFDSAEVFRDHMAQFANSRFSLDHRTEDLQAVQEWLDREGVPSYASVPEQIVKFRGLGCKSIDWGGNRVGLVCFKNADNQTVHLFIVERSALLDLDHAEPSFETIATRQELETGGWLDGDRAYLLVGSRPGVRVEPLLSAR